MNSLTDQEIPHLLDGKNKSKAQIASPEGVASQGEVIDLVLPLEVNLALLCRAFPASEVRRALQLALSSALPLASRQSFLAFGAENVADCTHVCSGLSLTCGSLNTAHQCC